MRNIKVTWNGELINAGRMVEKVRNDIEKLGVKLDDLTDEQALLMAANVKQMTIPEFLGV